MPRIRHLLIFAAGGAFLAPLFASGHGCEFLLARVDVNHGRVRLEITADVAGNPLFKDESDAAEAVRTSLRVRTPAGLRALAELGPVTLEKRAEWDAGAPALFSPATSGQPHQLTTAVWEWRPETDEVVFAVPKGNLHDVLLWTHDDSAAGSSAKWSLLIEGESSPVISVPGDGSGKVWLWTAGSLLVLAMPVFLGWRLRIAG